jgi:hypothetical protein
MCAERETPDGSVLARAALHDGNAIALRCAGRSHRLANHATRKPRLRQFSNRSTIVTLREARDEMDIGTYFEKSNPVGDQRGEDNRIAVTDLLNCLNRAAVDATASYTEESGLNVKLGDVLWYVAAIARRRDVELQQVAKQCIGDDEASTFDDYAQRSANADDNEPDDNIATQLLLNGLIVAAINTTSGVLKKHDDKVQLLHDLAKIFWHLGAVARRQQLSFSAIASDNLKRIETLFGASLSDELFDNRFDADEQLPRKISIRFSESVRNKLPTVRMAIKTQEGIWLPIGSALNDNSLVEDDYRFHDVLHLAYVAVLGWSPVMRALFGLKRKSSSEHDRVDDGARAILLEEALTGIIYEAASDNDLFKDHRQLERRLLLTVKRLTRSLEVRIRTYNQWTDAILRGYDVFREITTLARINRPSDGESRHIGLVNVDMNDKKIWFEP